jgi:hypothetical protein
MKKIIQFLYVVVAALLLSSVTGCSSTGYSGSYSGSYYGGSSWGYDSYYRSGVNRHYNRSTTRVRATRPSGGGGGRGRR